jgi:hypothetical protein
LLLSGLVTAIAAGAALRATGAFVPLLRGGILAAVLATAGFLAALRPGAPGALIAAAAALGAVAVPLLPLTLENAAEATFPVREDASAALLTGAGKAAGAALVFGLQPLLARGAACDTVATPAAALVAAGIAVSAAAILTFKKDYRRGDAECAFAADEAAQKARSVGPA